MKIIFSRKGVDSSTGRVPSPFVDGRPVSLPAPIRDLDGNEYTGTTYQDLCLGDLVEQQTRSQRNKSITRDSSCHPDPAFHGGWCAFGQTGPAQSHLANQDVGIGSVFLFFGLFENSRTKSLHPRDREHWLFGYLRVQQVICLGARPRAAQSPWWLPYRHPNTVGHWHPNNTLYVGEGCTTRSGSDRLRLTVPGGPTSRWKIPDWLHSHGKLSCHDRKERWLSEGILRSVGRGQEFVCDICDARQGARTWVDEIAALMAGSPPPECAPASEPHGCETRRPPELTLCLQRRDE